MIKISIDAKPLMKDLDSLAQRQLPFAISKALNDTAKGLQQEMRVGIANRFELRRPQFVLNTVKIERGDFANVSQNKWSATVSIGDDGRHRNSGLLTRFEEGVSKTGTQDVPVAIPTQAIRPSFHELVPKALYPKNLGLSGSRLPASRTPAQNKSRLRRAFVLGEPGQKGWGIYQRTGPGHGGIRMIWQFKLSIPIPRRLQFLLTAERYVPAAFDKHFAAALEYAIRTAR